MSLPVDVDSAPTSALTIEFMYAYLKWQLWDFQSNGMVIFHVATSITSFSSSSFSLKLVSSQCSVLKGEKLILGIQRIIKCALLHESLEYRVASSK